MFSTLGRRRNWCWQLRLKGQLRSHFSRPLIKTRFLEPLLNGVVTLSLSGRKRQRFSDLQATPAAIFPTSIASRRWYRIVCAARRRDGTERQLRVAECIETNRCNMPSARGAALHGSFPFTERQMAILGPIIEALVRTLVKAGCHFCLCRAFITPLLQDFIENGAVLIHRTPEFLSSAFDDDLVQIPNITEARLMLP